jgi:hypothetical protein
MFRGLNLGMVHQLSAEAFSRSEPASIAVSRRSSLDDDLRSRSMRGVNKAKKMKRRASQRTAHARGMPSCANAESGNADGSDGSREGQEEVRLQRLGVASGAAEAEALLTKAEHWKARRRFGPYRC